MAADAEERAALAARLKKGRVFLGLTQQQVADALSIGRSAVADIERVRRRVSGFELRRFARLYGVPVGYLLGEELTDADEVALALVKDLSERDQEAVLRLAQFLASESSR